MTVPFVVPAYGALLALIYLALSFRVSAVRGRVHINIGSGGNPALERAIRAHGNFAEYVPLALLLLGFLEMQRASASLLHALCLLLLLGRVSHAIGISREPDIVPLRAAGMLATYLVLAVAALMLLYHWRRGAAP